MNNDFEAIKARRVAARVSRIALVRSLEKRHPGMVVFTRAFLIQHPDLGKRKREIEACTQIKEELTKAKVGVQVVLTSAGAYVLRATESMHTSLTEQKKKIQSHALKRRRCWGSSRKGDS